MASYQYPHHIEPIFLGRTTATKSYPLMATVTKMTHEFDQERASKLALEAVDLAGTGQAERASRKLREAASLDHDNVDVQSAFLTLHRGQEESPLLALCRKYALYSDRRAGAEAVGYLTSNQDHLSATTALECLKLILDSNYTTLSSAQDSIIVALVQQSSDVRRYFVSEMQLSTTEYFDNVYERGDGAANCLRSIVLESSLWKSEVERLRVEEDLFQLFLAKLMESGHDLDGRALKGIALLLVNDAHRLHALVDSEGFDAILGSLDISLPADVRIQATLASSRYLEVSGAAGRENFTKFVTSRVRKPKNKDLTLAFSATASLFPIIPAITTPLFLTPGFLQLALPLVDLKPQAPNVDEAFLQLLNAACVDEACRSAISTHCSAWLSHIVSNGKDNRPALAATVLAKLRSALPSQDASTGADLKVEDDGLHGLVRLFKQSMSSQEASDPACSIEGLAYASLKGEVKEELARDNKFLQSFLQTLKFNSSNSEMLIGGLSVIANLTHYTPKLSEEQQKMVDLKAYANASQPMGLAALNDDEHVTARCNAVMEANVMPVLIGCSKGRSTAAPSLVKKILLSLSTNPKSRGKIAQQGGISLLLHLLQREAASQSAKDGGSGVEAAHALAKILISVDPRLVFPPSGLPSITSAIQPLVDLLKPSSAHGLSHQMRDLLPTFESLLALTNLASSPDSSAGNLIVRTAWDAIEDLLLSDNTMIRRASCELVCNLATTRPGVIKYADGSGRSIQRLHTLLAMADVEDLPTRRAAGGALAMLSEHDVAVASLLELKRGLEIPLCLCQDTSEEIVHRGLICLSNISCAGGETGERARKGLKEAGGVEILQRCVKQWKTQSLLQPAIEILNALKG